MTLSAFDIIAKKGVQFVDLMYADLMGGFAIDEADANEDTARLGNAGEPFDLTYCDCRPLAQSDMPVALLIAFAEARGEGANTLDDVKSAALATVRE